MKMKHKPLNKKSKSSDNVNRVGKAGMRSKATIQRLNMYKGGKPIRNKDGKIIGGPLCMSTKAGNQDLPTIARIAPDRRWFGNTRTISQTELDKFREEMSVKAADPYSVVLRRKKIPMALLQDAQKVSNVNLLETERFDSIMGKKSTRKRPKFTATSTDYGAIMADATERANAYVDTADSNIEIEVTRGGDARKEDLFSKGQSKRIWGELYKVLDSSDVILQVVDARNVPGTRCGHIENHIKKNATHKHLIILLNKCDLVPSWVTRKWVKILSKEFPTLAFHASITNSFGKGALISLLRQFAKLHIDKRQISVGVIGYPNTGKSSVINTLMAKKCCKTAPIPGETKVWQYIALMKRIFLIDCPGVVYDVGDDETEIVLKGVVRAERLPTPSDYIQPILDRVRQEFIQRRYEVQEWTDALDFLTQLAKRSGRLLKGGEPDLNQVAVNVINDWQRGKLPYYVAPPKVEGDDGEEEKDDDVAVETLTGDMEEEDEDGEDQVEDNVDMNAVDDEDIEVEEETPVTTLPQVTSAMAADLDWEDL